MKKLELILLVDDDFVTNFYNEDLLERMDIAHKIHTAKDGQEALDFILKKGDYKDNKDSKPCLILLDINMPRMNGFEFLEVYKNIDTNLRAQAVVCMLTTSLNHEDKIKADNYPVISSYLSKPLNEEKIQHILTEQFAIK